MKNEQHSVVLFGSLAFLFSLFYVWGRSNGVFVTIELAQSLLAETTEVCHSSPKNNKALLPSFLVN